MKLIVAITGASGAKYGIRILEELRKSKVETHLIVSRWGRSTIECETDYDYEQVIALADHHYQRDDMYSAAASGSAHFDGMVVVPCSMKTLASIRHGYSDSLITRAADVMIKERRQLILVTRETPLSPIHLENMLELSRIGVIIMPPVPAFYAKPKSVDELIDASVSRIFDQLGIDNQLCERWGQIDQS